MGKILLVARLATRDLRRHRAQAALLFLAITAATTVLALGLALSGVTNQPYQQTRTATKGPDVVGSLTTPDQATALIHASGVSAASGPYPLVYAVLRVNGRMAGAQAEGRTEAPAAVDQPDLTAGSWVRPGGVVIERTFAEAFGVTVGDRLTLNGQSFTVAGIAVTAAIVPYPNICYSGCSLTGYLDGYGIGPKDIGLVWMTEPAVMKLTSAADPLAGYVLNLKLRDPDQAQAFANRYTTNGPSGPAFSTPQDNTSVQDLTFNTWQYLASSYGLLVTDEQAVLVPGAVLLCLLALASVAVLVGGRLAENTRRVGLLKAAGGTPGLIAATFLAENLVLALAAGAAGLTAGILAAPLLTSPGAALVGAPGAPSLTPLMVVAVLGVALVVTLASTLAPAIRAARSSTVSALADSARPPRRHGTLIRLSRRLPVPALFGLRLAARRPRRALLSAASIAVTVCGIVAVLAFHATVSRTVTGSPAGGLVSPVVSRDEQMLLVITIMLITLSALNAIFTAWATVLDARRPSALMRALGARSRQVSTGLLAAQVLSVLPGAIAGVPLGIVLFGAVSRHQSASPSALWVAASVLGTLLAVAGLTTVPALIGARTPAPQILQSETN
ncbi:MAG TPA: ABC transporter permease [Streptosporangiaceae bacterium]|nr:ABC transporter permease [Streptosporangiaceae bacterium]